MTNEMSLKPCPFCGAQPEQRFTLGASEMFLQCACGVRMFGDSDLAVIEKWNRRAAEPSEDARDAARWRYAVSVMCYSFDGENRTHYLKANGRESFAETVDRRRAENREGSQK